jgi:uncharacterized protein
MNNLLRHLNLQQSSQLEELLGLLVKHFQPEKIYCFGSRIQSSARFSCFVHRQKQGCCAYDLLVITPGTAPGPPVERPGLDKEGERKTLPEQEMQDFVNSRYKKGKVTILCHSAEVVNAALQLGHPFFIRVLREGLLLYSSAHTEAPPAALPGNPAEILLNSREQFRVHLEQAAAFLQTAWEHMAKENHTLTLLMLHQTLLQGCSGLMRLFTGYYSGSLPLSKLIRLCSNFTDELVQLFPQNTPDELRLFRLLLNSAAGSQNKANISKEEIHQLFERTAFFLDVAENLCRERMKEEG